ncbi:MAG: MBL fold metallo-hydrolase [Candidatus Micrarchaeia archaeon]
MRLRFLGGAREVGRSSIVIEDRKKIMLDCGIKLDSKTEYPEQLAADLIIVSHAHLDHSGFSPFYYKFSSLPSIGTYPTLNLTQLLLKDFLKVQRRKHEKVPFKDREIRKFVRNFIVANYEEEFAFGDFSIKFHDAGHIPGSCMVELNKDGKKIFYTADFKLTPTYLHKGTNFYESDILIIESTYANREHPPRKEVEKRLKEEIEETISKGGNVLMPTFAVGRAQEMLFVLDSLGFSDIVYLDGMAKDATQIILNSKKFISDPEWLQRILQRVNFVEERRDRREALKKPSIILTTAGMLNGGPALDYITKLNLNSKIIFTGYQVEGTNGRELLEKGVINLNGKKFKVPQKAIYLDFSAHAGRSELFKFVEKSKAEKIFVVHGDSKIAIDFKDELLMLGYDAVAPQNKESFEISF